VIHVVSRRGSRRGWLRTGRWALDLRRSSPDSNGRAARRAPRAQRGSRRTGEQPRVIASGRSRTAHSAKSTSPAGTRLGTERYHQARNVAQNRCSAQKLVPLRRSADDGRVAALKSNTSCPPPRSTESSREMHPPDPRPRATVCMVTRGHRRTGRNHPPRATRCFCCCFEQ
jgi:hypothetical protein